MFKLLFDENERKYYIPDEGRNLYIHCGHKVRAAYNNGEKLIISGIVYFSKKVVNGWYILDNSGNDYIPLSTIEYLEIIGSCGI
jgi:hypothetical protein